VTDEFDDPVMRQNFTSDNKYYIELGKQITKIVKPIVEKSGGQMSLTDAFCTVNRARGLDVRLQKLHIFSLIVNCFVSQKL
jgi:hypothetical protein